MTDPGELGEALRASVTAPAGYGKTYLIAETTTHNCEGRQLILTHTHAGVQSLRKKLKEMACPKEKFNVDTIAGWCLRYVKSYPEMSGASDENFNVRLDWDQVYRCTGELLKTSAIISVIQNSYQGVFVDEYQDCTRSQHQVITQLANLLPCRILGDPLQSIFQFDGGTLDWEEDVVSFFEPLKPLTIPYRWKKTNRGLGEWLAAVRTALETNQPISLTNLPPGVRTAATGIKSQITNCFRLANCTGSVVAIHEGKRTHACHSLASKLRGSYQSMETVESQDLKKWVERFEDADSPKKAIVLIDFAAECFTAIANQLQTARKILEGDSIITNAKKHLEIIKSLQKVEQDQSARTILETLRAVSNIPGASPYRLDLWWSFQTTIQEFEDGDFESLVSAAKSVRDKVRIMGSNVRQRTVSRTLLIKGLQFDHAIVLDPNDLDRNQLYVALTRGSRTLTILTDETRLNPPIEDEPPLFKLFCGAQ